MKIELLVDILGWVGALALLTPYFFVSIGKIKGNSVSFQISNLAGSFLLIVNSLYYGALPSVAVNLVWIVIGCAMLVRIKRGSRDDQL